MKVVPSINSMNKVVMGMYAGDYSHLDAGDIGRAVMEWYAMSLERGLTTREVMPAELFVDCTQQEIAEAPMTVARRIYEGFGLELGPDAAAAMQTHVDANPKGKHGRHDYDLASFGLTEDEVCRRFDFYLQDSHWNVSA